MESFNRIKDLLIEDSEMKASRKQSRSDTVRRIMNAYKRLKRKRKIEKLLGDDNHWKGLS